MPELKSLFNRCCRVRKSHSSTYSMFSSSTSSVINIWSLLCTHCSPLIYLKFYSFQNERNEKKIHLQLTVESEASPPAGGVSLAGTKSSLMSHLSKHAQLQVEALQPITASVLFIQPLNCSRTSGKNDTKSRKWWLSLTCFDHSHNPGLSSVSPSLQRRLNFIY